MLTIFLIVAGVFILLAGCVIYRHQCVLRERAQLMRDAVRHHDFSFRLSPHGLLFGERALQEALNDMGEDIQQLVARNEVEAWQRLTRVLTHEIMNATTPILSISQAYLQNEEMKGLPYAEGIQAIHDTCLGLASFVGSYRKLTQLQPPVMGEVRLSALCQSVAAMYPQLTWRVDIPAGLVVRADEQLLRQVLIHLVKNAVEAEAVTIGLKWEGSLFVSNDGHAIPADVAREIFIPFFTTKSSGTGIGLSLSRQILLMQHMMLTLKDTPLQGYTTTFVISPER